MENIIIYRNKIPSEKDAPLHFCYGGLMRQDENFYLKRKNLAEYLLLYTISGEGYLAYDNLEYQLLPGTVFLIDCRKEQIYHTVGSEWFFSFVHFRTASLNGYIDDLLKRHGAVFAMKNSSGMESRIHEVNLLFEGLHPAAPHLAFSMLAEILGLLWAAADHPSEGVSEYTARVLQIIDSSYAQKLTLDVIAQRLHYSKYYLAHQFKHDLGLSIHDYLTHVRISQSKLLLQNTGLSVAAIAEQVGFSSASSYIHFFARSENVTPHQYRKQWI